MKLVPGICWTVDADPDAPLDARVIPLLEAIAETGSLAAAVRKCRMSYRAGWGLLRDYQRRLMAPLVVLARGRGAVLAPAGARLVAAGSAATRRFAPLAAALSVDLGQARRPATTVTPAHLRIAASHDLALLALRGALPAAAGLELELSFVGSLNALETFAAGHADLAGFHVALDAAAARERVAVLRWLRPGRDRLVRFVDREQGLILPAGNPARVKSFRDIAAKGLRFVNRQRGSGTRLIIDRLVVREGVAPEALAGFTNEEFTHPAIAATVASVGADAGFGLRAAAAEYGLAFVPLVRERYFLAFRARDARTPAIARLVATLRGPLFAQLVKRLPGYRATGAGTAAELSVLGAGAGKPA